MKQRLRLACLALCLSAAAFAQTTNWPVVGNDQGAQRNSPLKQIKRDNVAQLKVAWTYHTGDAEAGNRTTMQCTPIVIDGVMYLTTAKAQVVALAAATGQRLWSFDPFAAEDKTAYPIVAGNVNRGVAYWVARDSQRRRIGGRIIHGTADGRLISLDALTGKPDVRFGRQGVLDLHEGLEPEQRQLGYGITSAPAVFENLVIIGASVGEGPGPAAAGDVRAFDARTGKEAWRFHTVPRPGEFGHETWEGEGWRKRGGVNAWSGATIDEKRGMVFVATGSAAFDFYGGDRPGDNLFANCVIALDARTGQRRWHFQTVKHDIWDYDNPTPPRLITVTHGGKKIDAVAQLTKTGFVFLFDRVTGKPLFEVVERAAPVSDTPGERAAATQIFPVKPPSPVSQAMTEEVITNLSKASHNAVAARLKTLRHGAIFTPLSLQGTVILPGLFGGFAWSGAAYDATTGVLYANTNNVPRVIALKAAEAGKGYPYRVSGYDRLNDPEGYPAVKPPWGALNAIDLNEGKILWQVPLGEFAELTERGLAPTGTENLGGAIVTAGGLVFIAASKDEKLRAFDKTNGKILWEAKLPAGGYATPMTYAVKGQQFVVIAAGGGGKLLTKSGDAFVAFALP